MNSSNTEQLKESCFLLGWFARSAAQNLAICIIYCLGAVAALLLIPVMLCRSVGRAIGASMRSRFGRKKTATSDDKVGIMGNMA